MAEPVLGCRSVAFAGGVLTLIDQRKLPGELVFMTCTTAEDVFHAIREMAVRGAPAIGAAGAFGVAIAARGAVEHGACVCFTPSEPLGADNRAALGRSAAVLGATQMAKEHLDGARPTAVNLSWVRCPAGAHRMKLLGSPTAARTTALARPAGHEAAGRVRRSVARGALGHGGRSAGRCAGARGSNNRR